MDNLPNIHSGYKKLQNNGKITQDCFTGETRTATTATGQNVQYKVFIINNLKIGNVDFKKVEAGVCDNQDCDMLLGQSVLKRMAHYTITPDALSFQIKDIKNQQMDIDCELALRLSDDISSKAKQIFALLNPYENMLPDNIKDIYVNSCLLIGGDLYDKHDVNTAIQYLDYAYNLSDINPILINQLNELYFYYYWNLEQYDKAKLYGDKYIATQLKENGLTQQNLLTSKIPDEKLLIGDIILRYAYIALDSGAYDDAESYCIILKNIGYKRQ